MKPQTPTAVMASYCCFLSKLVQACVADNHSHLIDNVNSCIWQGLSWSYLMLLFFFSLVEFVWTLSWVSYSELISSFLFVLMTVDKQIQ